MVQSFDDQARSVGLFIVMDGIALALNVGSTHSEFHLGSTAVLNGSVATKLDQISKGHHVGNVVSNFTDLSNLGLGELQIRTASDLELILQHQSASWSPAKNG